MTDASIGSRRIPNPYLLGTDGGVRITNHVARVLQAEIGRHLDGVRIRSRGRDPEVTYVLEALREAGLSAVPLEEPALRNSEGPIPDWMSTTDAAQWLEVSTRWIRKLCESGELPATRIGRSWRVSRDSLEAYKGRRPA